MTDGLSPPDDALPSAREVPLTFANITAIPVIHGRVAFAMEVRRRMLAHRFDALAVELPPSLRGAIDTGIDALPTISVVLYRERPDFLDPEQRHFWYVPIDPADAIIEGLRIARGERTPTHFVDAEIEEFQPAWRHFPDPHAIHTLGLHDWYQAVLPLVWRARSQPQDRLRERHMAARLAALSQELGPERHLLFLCGLAHWHQIRSLLEAGNGVLHSGTPLAPELVQVERVHPRSLPHLLGEMPFLAHRFELHRGGPALADFDPVEALKDLLLLARDAYEKAFPETLERATPQTLRTLLLYLRKLTVGQGRLLPDTWSLGVAAKGTVGNDYAVKLLEQANRYPPNDEGAADSLRMTDDQAGVDEHGPSPATPRVAREPYVVRPLSLRRRPPRRNIARWRRGWNPNDHCSWPPEDVVIENFRHYVTRRALTMAGLALRKTEPFTTSFKDGIALRETLQDWRERRIHVKEEPRVAGNVGALVLIFEEDDFGTRFPWRSTWLAEHEEESTLAFYATDPKEDIVGPGIGRMFYGGCLFLFPPLLIPDVWDDLRFERARRPSERLLLAGIAYSREKFIAYAAPSPPAPEVQAEAARFGRHIVYIPLTSFAPRTLERLRRAHVLNGKQVRSWASRFI